MGVEAAAPPVVVVIVACRPGPWFDDVLRCVADQDYPELSVLVAAVGEDAAIAGRVAAVLPDAHLAHLKEGLEFAEAANQAMGLVSGVAHVVICHDDVALAPGAIRALVGEAYRSNAGLVCPKCVLWDAPDRLLSVGMGADRLGVTYPLVEAGELDQGQHDAVRPVFVAPSGAVLARTDLWEALGGYDLRTGTPGEDLDLSWRAQLAGARVVVAPQAVARHLQAETNGLRPGPLDPYERRARTEEHRLRSLWAFYGARLLPAVVIAAVVMAVCEALWALARRQGRRDVLLPMSALARSFAHPRDLWGSRREAQRLRRAGDMSLWRVQRRGSARLRSVARSRVERGHQLAWAAAERRAGWHWPAAALACVAVVALVGSRHLLDGPLPLVGALPPSSGGTGSWWAQWWSGRAPGGFGGPSWASPALAVMGLLGAFPAFGSAALAAHVLVLAPLVVGPLGVHVGSRGLGPPRGRAAATVLYAAVPVPYDAMAQGHWEGLCAYAALPWLLSGLYHLVNELSAPSPGRGGALAGQRGPARDLLHRLVAAWPRLVVLGLGLAVGASFAPSLLLVTVVVGAAFSVGSLLSGSARGSLAAVAVPLVSAAIAFVALAPWSFTSLGSWSALMGPPGGAGEPLGVAAVLRLQTGPFGGGPLGFALVAAALVSLVIGRSWRLAWAGRFWMVALACGALVFAGSRGAFPAPQLEVLTSAAAAGLVFAVAIGAASAEADLSAYRFGWRQLAPPFGALAVAAAVVPLLAWVGSGQWDLPSSGAEAAYAFPQGSQAGDYRVLWAGPQGSLPMAPGGQAGAISFGLSVDGLPSAGQLWLRGGATVPASVARSLSWAQSGATTLLGRLLAPIGVRYVVVPAASAGPAAAGLVQVLSRQVDLVPVGIDPSYDVYVNASWLPVFSVVGRGAAAALTGAASPRDGPWQVAARLQQLDAVPLATGYMAGGGVVVRQGKGGAAGDALYGAVPPGSWTVSASGRRLLARPAGPGGSIWALPGRVGAVSVTASGTGGQNLAAVLMVVAWALALTVAATRLGGRRRTREALGLLHVRAPGAGPLEGHFAEMLEEPRVV